MCRQCPGGPGYVFNGVKDAQSFVTLQFSTTTWKATLDCGVLGFSPRTELRLIMLTMKLKDRINNDIERLLATIKQSESPD